jgi:UDP-N-acetylmuramoyl-L-alanyl-D-glutamate--2,6-diaminopimelate ligase
VTFRAVYRGETEEVSLPIPGMFSVHNALTALSVCLAADIPFHACAASLCTAKGVKGRVEAVPTGSDYSVIIDYSHKPDALENVLKTLRPVTKGRLITLFGCGGDRDRTKRPVMGRVAADYSDFVIVTSDNPRTEDPLAIIAEITAGLKDSATPSVTIPDRIEAIHYALDNALAGDVILLAGKGHEDYQIIGHEKHHMDEREIVSDYLKEKGIL